VGQAAQSDAGGDLRQHQNQQNEACGGHHSEASLLLPTAHLVALSLLKFRLCDLVRQASVQSIPNARS